MGDTLSRRDVGERSKSSPSVLQALCPRPLPSSEGLGLKTVECCWSCWRMPCCHCLPEVARAANGGAEGLLVGDRVRVSPRRGRAQDSGENWWR